MLLYYISGMMFLMLSLLMFFSSFKLLIDKINYFIEWNFFNLNSINLNMYMYIDWMTMLFMFTVFFISSMIMFYCIEYMNHEINKIRFFWILFFFIMSMMMMILSPNIMMILIGWDGLGLTSYCLIIYYQSKNSFNCGMLTMLINRLGDIFIIMSVSLMASNGSYNLMNYNKLNFYIVMLFIFASFTKSAQFPFSSWLPAAMAAPTPVSSLVHSSTLVTAGIYMLIRFNKLIYCHDNLLNYIMMTGIITMFMAGMSANFEYDIKKIIAYSTLSQLGLMMMILSMKLIELAFFHLIIHAMFKSMMFMCSGIIIHSMNNFQDIRYMGKLKDFLPMTSMMFMISNFSLCGMPFFSGFYSKDLILENMFLLKMNFSSMLLLLLGTMLTVIYSIRLSYFLMKSEFKFLSIFWINEFKLMNYPMMLLMLMSIMFGMFLNWLLYNNIEMIFLLNLEKCLIMFICLLGMMLSLIFYKNYFNNNKINFIKFFLSKMWFLYKFNYLMIWPILKFGKFYSLMFDKGWSEEIFKNMFMKMNYINLFNFLMKNYFMNLIVMLSYLMVIMFLML